MPTREPRIGGRVMAVLEAAQAARPGSQTTCPTVAVIGTGLIGTSVGPALKRSGVRVPGADVDPSNLVRAVDLGAIDKEFDLDGLRSGDAVVVAVPTGSTEVVLENDVAVTEALDAYIDRLSPSSATHSPSTTASRSTRSSPNPPLSSPSSCPTAQSTKEQLTMHDPDPFDAVARRAENTAAYAEHPSFSPMTLDRWPVTEKATVKTNPERYRTGARAAVRITSSGTTGTPMPWYRTREENERNADAVARAWDGLLGRGIGVASALDHNAAAAGQLLELAAVRNEWTLWRGFPYRIGGARMDLLADAFMEFRPVAVVATPSGLIDIEQAWRTLGRFEAAAAAVRSLLLIGAPAVAGMQVRLARAWSARSYIASYGATELGTIACGCPSGQLHILKGRHLLELRHGGVVEPFEAGGTGELVVTPFFSEATQLVRYATGDVVSAVNCGCSGEGPAIAIAGRADDIVLAAGQPAGPEFIEHVIFVSGGAGDYLLEIDEEDRLVGIQVLPLGDAPLDLPAIEACLDAPVRVVDQLPALVRAGGTVKSWRRTRTVTIYGSNR